MLHHVYGLPCCCKLLNFALRTGVRLALETPRALRTSSAVGVSANHFRITSSARAWASSLSA